jgi:hypothetical protein
MNICDKKRSLINWMGGTVCLRPQRKGFITFNLQTKSTHYCDEAKIPLLLRIYLLLIYIKARFGEDFHDFCIKESLSISRL